MVGSSENNRYSFHAPTLDKPGVTLNFVYDEVLCPLEGIGRRLSTAATVNPNSTGTQEGLALLKGCIGTIETALSPNLGLNF